MYLSIIYYVTLLYNINLTQQSSSGTCSAIQSTLLPDTVVVPGTVVVPATVDLSRVVPGVIDLSRCVPFNERFVGYERMPPRVKQEPPRKKVPRTEPIQNDFTMQYMLHPKYS